MAEGDSVKDKSKEQQAEASESKPEASDSKPEASEPKEQQAPPPAPPPAPAPAPVSWADIPEDEDIYAGGPGNGLGIANLNISTGGSASKPEPARKGEGLYEAAEGKIQKIIQGDTPYSSAASFEDLQLSQALLRGLYSEMKFEKPSRIQAETLPLILQPPHRNLIAQAHNGSGKTTCFVLGMLSRVDPNLKAPQSLCICPTRELAIQNEEVTLRMAKYTGITVACTAQADQGYAPSASRRDKLVDQVVIGTPGTLKRWLTKDRILEADNIKILVFDEADHMLDQDGFRDDSIRLLKEINRKSRNLQVLLFSATFSDKVKRFAKDMLPAANQVFVPREELSLDVIKQYRVEVPFSRNREQIENDKIKVLEERIFPAADKAGQSIVFVRTRESARVLFERLQREGHKCTVIHGGMEHADRDRVIQEFRNGTTKILISTDVLARGFDQANVTLVVNYDIPVSVHPPFEPEYETYLHRIGRSGRFGRKGAAFNFVGGERDTGNLNKIEEHFQREIRDVPWDDDDAFERVLEDAGLKTK